MNLSCPSAAPACRRACRSPRLASVISFSISGLTALALASVVLMRSCSISSLLRFISSALRCAESRLSLLRVFWWRMVGESRGGGPAASVLAQVQAAGVQCFDYLVDRLFAEVRDRIELRLGLRDQVTDGL